MAGRIPAPAGECSALESRCDHPPKRRVRDKTKAIRPMTKAIKAHMSIARYSSWNKNWSPNGEEPAGDQGDKNQACDT